MEAILKFLATEQRTLAVTEPSDVGFARRGVAELARQLRFPENDGGRVALVVTELASNIQKHAGSGELLLRPLPPPGASGAHGMFHAPDTSVTSGMSGTPGMSSPSGTSSTPGAFGIEIIALDKGPGIANLAKSFADGYSTAGSQGIGLGAVQRLANELDIYAEPGMGCAIRAVLYPVGNPARTAAGHAPAAARQAAPGIEVGAVQIALAGETACGDTWQIAADEAGFTVVVADGLGHGPHAHAAAACAIDVLDKHPQRGPVELMQRADAAMRGTRGAAVGIMRIDFGASAASFTGIGNISACIWGPAGRRQFMSNDGIVGHNMREPRAFDGPWHRDALLLMHSDGLTTRWDLGAYPGLTAHHPALVAAVLYRDFTRRRDDATIVVVRQSWQ